MSQVRIPAPVARARSGAAAMPAVAARRKSPPQIGAADRAPSDAGREQRPLAASEVPSLRGDGFRWTVRGAGFAIGAGLVIVMATVLGAALNVILLTFLGILLAAALDPLVAVLRRRFHRSRGQAIAMVYVVFFILVVGVAVLVVPTSIGEAQRVWTRIPAFLDDARTWAATVRPELIGQALGSLIESARTTVDGAGQPPRPGEVVQLGLTLAESAVSVTTLLVVVAFWLVERARLQRYVLAFIPAPQREGGRARWNRVERRLGAWVRGQLLLMAIIGIASGTAYQVIGLPSAVLLGLIAAICEAIPLVGPLLGAIPALLVATTLGPSTLATVAVAYLVIHVVEGNVLVPMVMRSAMGLSPLLVLLSIAVGGAVGGIVGAFLAIPVAATIEILLEPLQDRAVPVATEPHVEEAPEPEAAPEGRLSVL